MSCHNTLRYDDTLSTVYPKKYAHGVCFAVLCCGYTLTDFPISIRLTSLALWQSKDCPNASKATLMNMDKYFMWIHYEWLHNQNKAKHKNNVCKFLGIYCTNCLLMYCDYCLAIDSILYQWVNAKRRNSIANTLVLHLSCTSPLIYYSNIQYSYHIYCSIFAWLFPQIWMWLAGASCRAMT